MTPAYLTHYHLPDKQPFLSLSAVEEPQLTSIITELNGRHERKELRRFFAAWYVHKRKETELHLRNEFIKKGGTVNKDWPHYLVLGVSTILKSSHSDMREVTIPLSEIDERTISFTFPDSMASMELTNEPDACKPYHGQVFTLKEIIKVVREYGFPKDEVARTSKYGYPNYIEAQLWCDKPVSKYINLS